MARCACCCAACVRRALRKGGSTAARRRKEVMVPLAAFFAPIAAGAYSKETPNGIFRNVQNVGLAGGFLCAFQESTCEFSLEFCDEGTRHGLDSFIV